MVDVGVLSNLTKLSPENYVRVYLEDKIQQSHLNSAFTSVNHQKRLEIFKLACELEVTDILNLFVKTDFNLLYDRDESPTVAACLIGNVKSLDIVLSASSGYIDHDNLPLPKTILTTLLDDQKFEMITHLFSTMNRSHAKDLGFYLSNALFHLTTEKLKFIVDSVIPENLASGVLELSLQQTCEYHTADLEKINYILSEFEDRKYRLSEKFDMDEIVVCIKNVGVVDRLCKIGAKIDVGSAILIERISLRGNIEMLDYLIEHGSALDKTRVVEMACEKSQIEMLRHLIDHHNVVIDEKDVLYLLIAVRNDDLDLMKFLVVYLGISAAKPINCEIAEIVFTYHRANILRYLISANAGIFLDDDTRDDLIVGGYVDMIRVLVDNKYFVPGDDTRLFELAAHDPVMLAYLVSTIPILDSRQLLMQSIRRWRNFDVCMICHDNCLNIDVKKCGHNFHAGCFEKWGKRTCPYCSQEA